TPSATVPMHLRSAAYKGARQLGHGKGYRYPHDHPDAVVAQQYLPDEAVGRILYRPGTTGAEPGRAEWLKEVDRRMDRPER
ncbi:MAG: replication-associated recombination protein A, partial [Actinobacteria bacterium]|nr:replication-associated recombination protein A [Actinomycetota bacterium]NIS37499.1 replication-associated recombination protein A [Actinomycetota bacterium]NIT99309.1 replication-associated recombination protein A [Actinomycetota bacterium]NIU22906.1 replication-associated recombination protein A [Actinomycetota bacterium]NIU71910.1 replication-associated recombination protein A [Actinomycetota bacterium]